MSNMTPFEIRLELLKMAKELLTDDYFNNKDRIQGQWQADCEIAKYKGELGPKHPPYPDYPTEKDIIDRAITLNEFVYNISARDEKPSRRKTSD